MPLLITLTKLTEKKLNIYMCSLNDCLFKGWRFQKSSLNYMDIIALMARMFLYLIGKLELKAQASEEYFDVL